MASFTLHQDRTIWKAALLAYNILLTNGRVSDAGSTIVLWNTVSGNGSLFPPSLIPDAELAVTDRMHRISARSHLGRQLCPELGV